MLCPPACHCSENRVCSVRPEPVEGRIFINWVGWSIRSNPNVGAVREPPYVIARSPPLADRALLHVFASPPEAAWQPHRHHSVGADPRVCPNLTIARCSAPDPFVGAIHELPLYASSLPDLSPTRSGSRNPGPLGRGTNFQRYSGVSPFHRYA
jgi:hypothetical protein